MDDERGNANAISSTDKPGEHTEFQHVFRRFAFRSDVEMIFFTVQIDDAYISPVWQRIDRLIDLENSDSSICFRKAQGFRRWLVSPLY